MTYFRVGAGKMMMKEKINEMEVTLISLIYELSTEHLINYILLYSCDLPLPRRLDQWLRSLVRTL